MSELRSTGARNVAEDLVEALSALKACRNMLALAHNKPEPVLMMIIECDRILDKYPNLK